MINNENFIAGLFKIKIEGSLFLRIFQKVSDILKNDKLEKFCK
jgi:hypothetical protein